MNYWYSIGAKHALDKLAIDSSQLHTALDLAGLGALSIPVTNHLITKKNEEPKHQKLMAGLELGGLGLLAAPSIMKMTGH